MPTVEIKNSAPTKVTLTITVPVEELVPFLEESSREISKKRKIKGFRPGNAPYSEVVKEVGEMAVLEASLNAVVRKTFVKAVREHDLKTIGAPEINVTTLAPGNNLVYEATVILLPKIKKLADWKNLSIKRAEIKVSDKEIEQALKDLAKMRTKEARASKDEKIGKEDKAVVDLGMKKDGVPIEGGQTKGSFVFMNQESYLPGLQDALVGMKEDEEKTFPITFPKDHFQKNLAGSKVDVTAKLKEIFHLETPSTDDGFAKQLGFDSLEKLKNKLEKNILDEKKYEDEIKQEREVLDEVAKKSEFEDMPEALIESETNKMLHELRDQIHNHGLEFEQYLSSLKKSLDDLRRDFAPQARRRLEIALLLKEIAAAENIGVAEKELNDVINLMAKDVKDVDTKDRIFSEEYREYQTNIMQNRKAIDLLKSAILK